MAPLMSLLVMSMALGRGAAWVTPTIEPAHYLSAGPTMDTFKFYLTLTDPTGKRKLGGFSRSCT
jgi:hypothetical protein